MTFAEEDYSIDVYDRIMCSCRDAFIEERVFGSTTRGRADLVQISDEIIQRMHDGDYISEEMIVDMVNCMMAVHMEDI